MLIIEAFHPGRFLEDEIVERGLLKKNVARDLEILPHHLSEIFAGKRNISAKLAIKLEKLLGVSAASYATSTGKSARPPKMWYYNTSVFFFISLNFPIALGWKEQVI